MSKRLNFSIVVCVYNGSARIRDAIKSLQDQNYPNDKYEIIVVNDCSTDDTEKIVSRFKRVKLISHKKNKGVAVTRNTGLKAARGKWVAYMDDDCVADRNWLKELEASFQYPDTMAVGGLTAPRDLKYFMQRYLFKSGYGFPAPVSMGQATTIVMRLVEYVRGNYRQRLVAVSEESQVHEIYGANSAFIRKRANAVKGYDPTLRSAEDTDICRKMHEVFPDEKIHFNLRAAVRHDYTRSMKAYMRKLFRRQEDTFAYYKLLGMAPPIFPFPIAIAGLVVLSALITWWMPLVALAVLPLLFYSWWTVYAFARLQPEALLYAHVQALEETIRVTGLIRGFILAEHRKPKTVSKVPRKDITLNRRQLFTGFATCWLVFILLGITPIVLARQILGGLFLLILPGVLIALALRISLKTLHGWLYTLCGSVGFLILAALAANSIVLLDRTTLHFNTPLLTSVVSLMLFGLATIAWKRVPADKTIAVSIKAIKSGATFLPIFLLPVIAGMAAMTLNNTNNNIPSMVMFGLVTALSGGMIVWARKLRSWAIPLFLYVIGLTVIMLGALRGDFISGIDMAKEYYLYKLIEHAGYWSPSLYHDAYNACLSITLLPLSLSKLLGVSDMTIMRGIIPAIYALVPVMIYALYHRFGNRTMAILGALFFIVQPAFVTWSSIPLRQMIGFLFFGIMVLAIFDKKISTLTRNILIMFFGIMMILSHYSTSYLALGLLVISYTLEFIVHWWRDKQWSPWRLQKFTPTVRAPYIIALFIFAMFWYGIVTSTGGNITGYIRTGLHSIEEGNVSLSSDHANQTGVLDQLNIASKPTAPAQVWREYLKKIDTKYTSRGIKPLVSQKDAATITPLSPQKLPVKTSKSLVTLVNLLSQVVRKLIRVFLVLGLAVVAWNCFRRREVQAHDLFALSSGALLALVVIVPHASIVYDVGRTSQQLLVLLGLPTLFGGLLFFRKLSFSKLSGNTQTKLVSTTIILFLLFVSGFIGQIIGGDEPTMMFNNFGNQYDQLYAHEGEILAADWLKANKNTTSHVYGGYFGGTRLLLGGVRRPEVYNDILPWTIGQGSYVFSSYSETVDGLATAYYNGSYVRYAYPTKVLDSGKNLIYDNGQAKIYK